MRTRPRCIGLWLNDTEYEHLKEQSITTGLNANAYIRKLIMGEQIKPRPPDTYAKLLKELNAIGNNINQLAYQANYRGEASKAEIHEAAELVKKMWGLVKEAI